jgi:hypothetical protein
VCHQSYFSRLRIPLQFVSMKFSNYLNDQSRRNLARIENRIRSSHVNSHPAVISYLLRPQNARDGTASVYSKRAKTLAFSRTFVSLDFALRRQHWPRRIPRNQRRGRKGEIFHLLSSSSRPGFHRTRAEARKHPRQVLPLFSTSQLCR